jgi:hypothetical protein
MTSIFGPNGQPVLALVSSIPGLSADQVDQVTSAWRHASPRDRARAWAQLNRATGEDERYRILAAASLARREALETARRVHQTDWAFWAAACDAGAGLPPAPRSAATTTPWSPRSPQSCPRWAAAPPRHPLAPRPAPPTATPSRTSPPRAPNREHRQKAVSPRLATVARSPPRVTASSTHRAAAQARAAVLVGVRGACRGVTSGRGPCRRRRRRGCGRRLCGRRFAGAVRRCGR